MRLALAPDEAAAGDPSVERLTGDVVAPLAGAYVVRFATRTGALLRVDGTIAGAFDREHTAVRLHLAEGRHSVALEVERRSLPSSGLPSGPGMRWRLLLAQSAERASRALAIAPAQEKVAPASPASTGAIPLIGHAHLDVAWLWTYGEARRKAARTFATAVRLLEDDPAFVFTQSQPQLYAWVCEDEPELFARVQVLASTGRFDASGAAMWVEPDCNVPSGESLLRQLVAGIHYAEGALGTAPSVAWLPDSFGFANTLPTLLAHAGVAAFATTKLRWNDTTEFAHPRFWWEGPDGSRVCAALFASYEGDVTHDRAAVARGRDEPLVVGYSDGGGGPTAEMLEAAGHLGTWTTLGAWFAALRRNGATLPVVRDELYLEYHRGVATTHHDVKARNAALERALERAELAVAWTVALRASPFFLEEARRRLADAWEIVLRNQFHDVLPGTSIGAVYADAHVEYDQADALVAGVIASSSSALPRSTVRPRPSGVAPSHQHGGAVFENGLIRARVRDGTIEELRVHDGENLVRSAHVLAAYADRPKKWEAWNVDREYAERPVPVDVLGNEIVDDALFVRYRIGRSFAAARFSLAPGEPFLRIDLAIDWRERRTLLRCESRIALAEARAFFGSPHGVVERAVVPATPAERAKFLACGQRFARVDGRTAGGGQPASVALLTLDTYGWSVGPDDGAGVRLGHSLLRGTTWPDPDADVGEHRIVYAFLPAAALANGALEAEWRRFTAEDSAPAMFACDDPAIDIVATKVADDGDGVVVRARECDGARRDARIACAARAVSVTSVDALERPLSGLAATLEAGTIVAPFGPFALRSFRVRFA